MLFSKIHCSTLAAKTVKPVESLVKDNVIFGNSIYKEGI